VSDLDVVKGKGAECLVMKDRAAGEHLQAFPDEIIGNERFLMQRIVGYCAAPAMN